MPRGLHVCLSVAAMAMLCHASAASAQIALNTAQNFGVLSGSSVLNSAASVVTGDVGVSPGSAVTGFPPGVVVGGTIHANDATAAQAQTDLTAAYNTAAGIACGTDLTGQNLGGLTLTPGVYCFSSSAALTGTLTLDFQGNSSAFFLFKIGSTLTTASGSAVVLANSGGTTCPSNVFWQVGSSATFGTGSSFVGNVLALTSITLTTGANLEGRALARNGAAVLDTTVVTRCAAACPVITLSPTTLAGGQVGVPYNQQVSASGAPGPFTFTVTSGVLPPGLTLNPASGVISGAPTAPGTFHFTITATDASSCAGSRAYDLDITAAGPAADIPTLSGAALVALAMMLAVVAMMAMGRLSS